VVFYYFITELQHYIINMRQIIGKCEFFNKKNFFKVPFFVALANISLHKTKSLDIVGHPS